MACGAAAIAAMVMSAILLIAPRGGTYAAEADYADIPGNTAAASVWTPNPPAQCGPLSNYSAIIYGSPGNDIIYGNNIAASTGIQAVVHLHGKPNNQIIMGLGGDDTLIAGNGDDCLVGGDGADTLIGGNGKDILLGGSGNDILRGGNGKDILDGGDGSDTCSGDNAPNRVSCENNPGATLLPAAGTAPNPGQPAQSVPAPGPSIAPTSSAPADTATPSGSVNDTTSPPTTNSPTTGSPAATGTAP